MLVASGTGSVDVAKLLIAAGANVNAADKVRLSDVSGYTSIECLTLPLHLPTSVVAIHCVGWMHVSHVRHRVPSRCPRTAAAGQRRVFRT